MLGEVPVLPNPPALQNDFYGYPLALFWKAQSQFELALRLHAALNARTDKSQKIQRILAAKEVQWHVKGSNSERGVITLPHASFLRRKVANFFRRLCA